MSINGRLLKLPSVRILGASLILKVAPPSIVSRVAASLYIIRRLLYGSELLISFTQKFSFGKYRGDFLFSIRPLLILILYSTSPTLGHGNFLLLMAHFGAEKYFLRYLYKILSHGMLTKSGIAFSTRTSKVAKRLRQNGIIIAILIRSLHAY